MVTGRPDARSAFSMASGVPAPGGGCSRWWCGMIVMRPGCRSAAGAPWGPCPAGHGSGRAGEWPRGAVRPGKADVFSGSQTHRGNSQEPRSWTAGRRETEPLKPVDKPICGWGASHRAGMKVNARWPRKCQAPEAEPATFGRRQHGTPPTDRRGVHSGGVISDGTMTRTRRATGEALLVPPRKRRSQVRPITTTPGKGAEGERVAEGPAVARKGSNVPGAIGPRCSAMPPTTRKAGATG